MSDEERLATDGPSPAGQAPAAATDAPPPDTAPPAAACAVLPAPVAPYVQFKVITWADTKGRTFVELQGTMGEAPIYRGMILVERAYSDGVGARRQIPFDIPATCVDEAFRKFDEAQGAARKAGEEETDREHTRAVLSGQIPPRQAIRIPMAPPPQGRRRRQ